MTTTIKKKIISGVALLCTIMLLIGILPTSVFRNNTADAANLEGVTTYVLEIDISSYTGTQYDNNMGIHLWSNSNSSITSGYSPLSMTKSGNKVYKISSGTDGKIGNNSATSYDSFLISENGNTWNNQSKDFTQVIDWSKAAVSGTTATVTLKLSGSIIKDSTGSASVTSVTAVQATTSSEQYHDSSVLTSGTGPSENNIANTANYENHTLRLLNYKNSSYTNLYVYWSGGEIVKWPGKAFTDSYFSPKEDGNDLILTIPVSSTASSIQIIFANSGGTSQYPSSGGLTMTNQNKYKIDLSNISTGLQTDSSSSARYKVGEYTYTGKYLTYSSDFYDYLSDNEVNNGYGKISDSSSSGWTDQNTNFNGKISEYANNNSGIQFPLYFGCFYQGNNNTDYTSSNKASYSKFYWVPNIAKRDSQATSVKGLVDQQLTNGNIAQGGVELPYFNSSWFDNNKVSGTTQTAVDSQIVNFKINGSTTLPRSSSTGDFNKNGEVFTVGKQYKTWFNGITGSLETAVNKDGAWGSTYDSTSTPNTMFTLNIDGWGTMPDSVEIGLKDKYGSVNYYTMTGSSDKSEWTYELAYNKMYDKNASSEGTISLAKYWKNIDFPFYQVKVTADRSGNSYASGSEPIYYQFNSRDSGSLYLDADRNKLYEHSTQVLSQNTDTTGQTRGFYPFNLTNTTGTTGTSQNNLGFGTKFNIEFTLTEDGKTGDVPTTFEFMGDDDVWVFVDGQLALDMGGAHKDAYGKIDFNAMTSTVESAVECNTSTRDNLGTAAQIITTDLSSILKSDDSYDSTTGKYNTKKKHTLTMFYMERGMFESDLFVRFNFSMNNNLIIKNQLTISDSTNAGFVNKTYAAANDDIFSYSLTNTNRDKGNATDTASNGLTYPSTSTHNRTVTNNSELISYTTTTVSAPGTITKTGNYSQNTDAVQNTLFERYDNYVSENGTLSKFVGTTDSSGQFGMMYNELSVFRKQFRKDTTLTLVQNESLNKLNKGATNTYGQTIESQTTNGSRNVSVYYNTTWTLTDSDNATLGTGNGSSSGTSIADNQRTTNSGTSNFTFNNMKGSTQLLDIVGVELTAEFVNTPKLGSLQIKKTLADIWDSSTQSFAIKVKFTDIFGNENVDFEQADYLNTTYTVGGESKSMGYDNGYGVIYIQKDQTAIISGIPVGTNYEISEGTNPYFETKSIKVNDSETTTGTISAGTTSTSTVTNQRITSGQLILVKDIIAEDETNPVTDNDRSDYFYNFDVEFEFDGVNLEAYKSSVNESLNCKKTMYAWDGKTDISTVTYWEPYQATDIEWDPVEGKTNTYKATFEVYPDHPVKIINIPYGTKYTVTEQDGQYEYIEYYSTKVGSTIKTDPWQNIISQSSEIITITNQKQSIPTGSLTITKVDADDNSIKLSGAEFTLYKNSSCTSRYGEPQTTGTDGTATFSNIPYGTYYLKETKAPGGYQSNGDVITVTVNSATVSLGDNYPNNTITNNKIVLPSTGGTGSDTTNYMFIGLAVIMIAGAVFLVFNRKVIFCKSKH